MILNDDSLMPFGRYKGYKMCAVSASYFHWCYANTKRSQASDDMLAVLDYIDRNMACLQDEYPDGIWEPA